MAPGMGNMKEKPKLQVPKDPKQLPAFLKNLISDFFKRLGYIFKLVWDTSPWILIGMLIFTVFNGLLPVALEYVNADIVNTLADTFGKYHEGDIVWNDLNNALWKGFLMLFVWRIVILVTEGVVSNCESILHNISGELVSNHIKVQLMTKADSIDISRFDQPDFYENLENANREASTRPLQILTSTCGMISAIVKMVGFLAVIFSLSGAISILMLLVSVPSAIINFIYRRKRFDYMRRRSKDRREMQYFSELMTNKDMVKEIRVLSLGKTFIKRYREVFLRYYEGLKTLITHENLWHIGITAIRNLVSSGLMLYVGYGVLNGIHKIGDYTIYRSALSSISTSITTLINNTATIYEGALFIDNVITFMEEESKMTPLLEAPLHPNRHGEHTFEFENVCFSYPGTERMVLKNLSFKIRPHETAVLVGVNGAGKTTLIKLLMRLYDPTSGRILMDGHDIREYDLKEYYRIFGVIFQDFGKYAVNVKENIAFGDIDKEPTEEAIRQAAIRSGSDPYVSKLSDGYNTPLMRIFELNGIELSGGQWQKLAVARAFYSDSDFIILDEPTAALDAIAEQEIYEQFDVLRENKITLFVSHRLSSATLASKILVIDGGVLAEEGTHAELMKIENGVYRKLFMTQASRYISEVPEADSGDKPQN